MWGPFMEGRNYCGNIGWNLDGLDQITPEPNSVNSAIKIVSLLAGWTTITTTTTAMELLQ